MKYEEGENMINKKTFEFNDLTKFIYGAMTFSNLPASNEQVKEIEDVARDYCVPRTIIKKILVLASARKKVMPNFDYVKYIKWELLLAGKEISGKRKRKVSNYREKK